MKHQRDSFGFAARTNLKAEFEHDPVVLGKVRPPHYYDTELGGGFKVVHAL